MTTTTAPPRRRVLKGMARSYPTWFYIPSAVLYIILFGVPTLASFYYSLTRWDLREAEFIGFANYEQFFVEPMLIQGFVNTFIFGFVTSGLKVVFGLALGLLLTSTILGRGYLRSTIFFPVLVSTIGIGITFKVLMDPFDGLINQSLALLGIDGPAWLTDPAWALMSVALVEVWRGVGIATLIYIAGLVAIPTEYYEAARVDGASAWQRFRNITLPLVQPATATVVLLSLIGGLRSFELIWAMTKGGPGFTSDVIASVIYKQYQAGFFGLSTAGNVVLFLVVTAIIIPVQYILNKRQVES
ncbi:carbohydrate ABC transporter permease [Microbacterium excoecariae]|uniref:carbohydrate ABC transporter permease n=1 Tax=Microbacterium excoecariae TaxID=2715210 RepID=UPI001408FD7D|nr:sugar ABC transporter permease [Microbacterium excoecariae]NHI15739.1 sugar ABC transporter permease [Microbacterium excoecariae]